MAPLPVHDFQSAAEMQEFYARLAQRLRPSLEPPPRRRLPAAKTPPEPPAAETPPEPPAAETPPEPERPPEPQLQPEKPPPLALQRSFMLRDIQRAVADAFGLSVADLLGPRRFVHHTTPRQLAMALARHLTAASLPLIGKQFNRDHSTVFNGVAKMQWLIAELHEGLPAYASLYEWVEIASQILKGKDKLYDEQREAGREECERRRLELQRAVRVVSNSNAGHGERAVLAVPSAKRADSARPAAG